MTNEELLAKIDEGGARAFQSDSYGWIALRAVVELHKPSDPIWSDGFVVCEICNYEYHRSEPYPCPTIQAIEKALQ